MSQALTEGLFGAIPPAATPLPPNRRPSPLSLRDISPHCGESPVARGAKNKTDRTQKGTVRYLADLTEQP